MKHPVYLFFTVTKCRKWTTVSQLGLDVMHQESNYTRCIADEAKDASSSHYTRRRFSMSSNRVLVFDFQQC